MLQHIIFNIITYHICHRIRITGMGAYAMTYEDASLLGCQLMLFTKLSPMPISGLSLLQVANDEPLMHIERHYTLWNKILIFLFLVVFAFDISSVLNFISSMQCVHIIVFETTCAQSRLHQAIDAHDTCIRYATIYLAYTPCNFACIFTHICIRFFPWAMCFTTQMYYMSIM